MMKRIKLSVLLLFAVCMVPGCGLRSGLKGKVVDAKGHPLSNVQVVATALKPGKHNPSITTMTRKNGIFQFDNLDPFSKYEISVRYEGLKTDGRRAAKTGMMGEIRTLKNSIPVTLAFNTKGSPLDLTTGELRFVKAADGVITDTETGLQWDVGPDTNTTWYQALAWISGLSAGGNGWRMPSTEELKTLYIRAAGKRHLAPVFATNGWWAWSGQEDNSSMAWYFTFRFDRSDMAYRDYSSEGRAFAVRYDKR